MSILKKFVDQQGLQRFWLRIKERYDKKLDSVTNKNETIEVDSGREISVRISSNKNNVLVVEEGNGLLVPKNHKLIFGPYEYDGSKDITVTIYDGEYQE